MNAKICVSLFARDILEVLSLIEKTEKLKTDLIEIRLDELEEIDRLSDIVNWTKTPLIATVRASKEGGKFKGTEEKRKEILLNAARAGFEYIDIELSMPSLQGMINELKKYNTKIIISFHDFEKTPGIKELKNVLKQEIDNGADVCKIITMAKKLEDNLTVLNFLNEESKRVKLVSFAMGEYGKISRVLSPFFGSYFTFVSLEKGKETALGQLSVYELKSLYEILGLS
ncbi:MAG: type I 3-dehydroquinate dehydratase [Candidatus Bathyarchaeia archaeon]